MASRYRLSMRTRRPWSQRLDHGPLERLAESIPGFRRLQPAALAVVDVERVERLVDLGSDPGAADVEPQGGHRPRDEIEQAQPVGALHLDHRVLVAKRVV